jgi:general transcriptional corepressor TUP1
MPDQSKQITSTLGNTDIAKLDPKVLQRGDDWHVELNPNLQPQAFNIHLKHTLVHPSVVCSVYLSRDSRLLATGGNHEARVYEVETGKLLSTFGVSAENGDNYVRSVLISPDGTKLVAALESRIVVIWDISTQKVIHELSGHEQDIYAIDYSSDGHYIVSCSGDHTVRMWDAEQGEARWIETVEDGLTSVATSSITCYIAAGCLDKRVHIWDYTGNKIDELGGESGHTDSVYSVCFLRGHQRVVSASLDKTIKIWALKSEHDKVVRGATCMQTLHAHSVE